MNARLCSLLILAAIGCSKADGPTAEAPRPVGPLATELVTLLDKISAQSPAVFEWEPDKIKQAIGPERQIKILPRLGSGRDIELQVRTGNATDQPLATRELASALRVKEPVLHQLPVTDGPVFRLANDRSDDIRYKGLELEIDVTHGDTELEGGIDLSGEGSFYALAPSSEVSYVMVKAPAAKP